MNDGVADGLEPVKRGFVLMRAIKSMTYGLVLLCAGMCLSKDLSRVHRSRAGIGGLTMCMVDMADGMSVVLHSSHRKANKEHRCRECRRAIAPGEKYLNEGLLWEGEKSTHKPCRHREVVRDWLVGECGGFIYGGEIEEDIREHAWGGYGIEVKNDGGGDGKKLDSKRR